MDNLYEFIVDTVFNYGIDCEKYAHGCKYEDCDECIKNVIKNHDNKIINDFCHFLESCTLWNQEDYKRLYYLKDEFLK